MNYWQELTKEQQKGFLISFIKSYVYMIAVGLVFISAIGYCIWHIFDSGFFTMTFYLSASAVFMKIGVEIFLAYKTTVDMMDERIEKRARKNRRGEQ